MGSSRSSRAPNQLEGSLFDVDSDQEMFIHLDMISGVADRSRKGRTLYSQVAEQIEAFALAGPLGEETMIPPEWELVEQLGVSRGTVRRAIADLERAGLLWREPGRGTFVNPAARLRRLVWDRVAKVAKADSRFNLDFSSFIPDFEGSEKCVKAIRDMPEYRGAGTIVAMPDNNLESFRHQALADGKRLLVFTYGMLRGALLLRRRGDSTRGPCLGSDPRRHGADSAHRSPSEQLLGAGPLDLLVTGAAAVSREGVHFGKGHGYLDLEWGLLSRDRTSGPGDSGDRVGSRLPGRQRAGALRQARRDRGRDRDA